MPDTKRPWGQVLLFAFFQNGKNKKHGAVCCASTIYSFCTCLYACERIPRSLVTGSFNKDVARLAGFEPAAYGLEDGSWCIYNYLISDNIWKSFELSCRNNVDYTLRKSGGCHILAQSKRRMITGKTVSRARVASEKPAPGRSALEKFLGASTGDAGWQKEHPKLKNASP
jgi:hypothetical protein